MVELSQCKNTLGEWIVSGVFVMNGACLLLKLLLSSDRDLMESSQRIECAHHKILNPRFHFPWIKGFRCAHFVRIRI